jgi:hypothetical protein
MHRVIASIVLQIIYSTAWAAETAIGMQDAFKQIGVSALILALPEADALSEFILHAFTRPEILYIVLGSGLKTMPYRYIFLQAEQMASNCWNDAYGELMSNALHIWDMSPYNIEVIQRGIEFGRQPCISILPLYVPRHSDAVLESAQKVVDILFYGILNEHRMRVLSALKAAGLVVEAIETLQEPYRTAHIRRAQIVLNLHYYADAVLEVHRINLLLSLGACVVSEPSVDSVLDNIYAKGVVFVRAEDMTTKILQLIADDTAREQWQINAQLLSARLQNNFTPLVKGIEAAIQRSAADAQ